MEKTNDLRIKKAQPLIPPREIKRILPLTQKAGESVLRGRREIEDILAGRDRRMIAIVGPCSIHDPEAALDYARRLAALQEKVSDQLLLVMRVYFEKPRTSLGWRGMIVDPGLDGSYHIEEGLKSARKLLLQINQMGIPTGSEVLDPIVPQYISDLISWAAIGARTTESQTHREITSGLSMPVGFKNGTNGDMDKAVNAILSSRHTHSFIGIDQNGQTCVLTTTGNPTGHVILRGGEGGPNYYEESVEEAEEKMEASGLDPRIIVDCSHANSSKKYQRQSRVIRALMDQRKRGHSSLVGFMLESNLFEGRQAIPEDIKDLQYGVSITDACIGWPETEELLRGVKAQLE